MECFPPSRLWKHNQASGPTRGPHVPLCSPGRKTHCLPLPLLALELGLALGLSA